MAAERLRDEVLEPPVPALCGACRRSGPFGIRGGASTWRPYPRADGASAGRRARTGRDPRAGGLHGRRRRRRRIHFLDWGGPPTAERSGRRRGPRLGQTAWAWTPVARRLAGPSGSLRRSSRWTCAATACPTRRPRTVRTTSTSTAATSSPSPRARASSSTPADRRGRGRTRVRRDRGGPCGGARARRPLRRTRPRRRRLGVARGRDRPGRRRVPARPRRTTRGHALDAGVPRRPARLRPDARGTPTRTGPPGRPSSRPMPVASSRRPDRTRPRRACGRCSSYDPLDVLPHVRAPVVGLDRRRRRDRSRAQALASVSTTRDAAGARRRSRVVALGQVGHNLMRYRPREVAAAILDVTRLTRHAVEAGARCRSSTRPDTSRTTSIPRRSWVSRSPPTRSPSGPSGSARRSTPTAASRSPSRPNTASRPSPPSTTRGWCASSRSPGRRCVPRPSRGRSCRPTRTRTVAMFEGMSADAVERLVREPQQVGGRAGFWGLDSAAPLVAGTYDAARGGRRCRA